MILPVLALLLALPAVGATATDTQIHYVMGTYLQITAHGPRAGVGMERCFREARRLDAVFSRWDAQSELSRVNAGAGASRPVSPDFARLLARSLALGVATGGAFDVTVGPLMAIARAGGSPAAMITARAHVGAGQVALSDGRLTLAAGARLDFDGIAKGWAVDRCTGLLRAVGVRRALVSLGESSIAALGTPPGADTWELTVRAPDDTEAVGVLRLRDRAASISAARGGPGGQHAAHIVDPRSGQLVAGEAVAVVVAATATDAEAYSKALLVGGPSSVDTIERQGSVGAVHVSAASVRSGRRARVERVFAAFDSPRPIAATEESPW